MALTFRLKRCSENRFKILRERSDRISGCVVDRNQKAALGDEDCVYTIGGIVKYVSRSGPNDHTVLEQTSQSRKLRMWS